MLSIAEENVDTAIFNQRSKEFRVCLKQTNERNRAKFLQQTRANCITVTQKFACSATYICFEF